METTPPRPTGARPRPAKASTKNPPETATKTGAHARSAPATVHDPFYARAFAIATVLVLAWALYQILHPFIGPLLWALFLAFLLHPLQVRITRKFKGRDNLSAALLTATMFIILLGPFAAFCAAFASQSGELLQWLQDTLGKETPQQYQALAALPLVEPVLNWLSDDLGIHKAQIQLWLAQGSELLPTFLAAQGGKVFVGALSTALAFVLMLFMLFFFIRDGGLIVALLRDLTPMTPARRKKLMEHVAAVTRAVVFGTGVTVLVQGAIVGVAFMITGLSSPLVFAVLAALLALLPFGGTAFVWIPATLLLVAQNNWGMAIVMLAVGTLSSTIDNVLRPLLISGQADVSVLTVFLGVIGGAAAFGPIGMVLGPVVLALIIALLRFALELRRAP